MGQLKMYWKNDGKAANYPTLPENVEIIPFCELENAKEEWLSIMNYGSMLPEVREEGKDYYLECMNGFKYYKDELCFIIRVGGVSAASITVVCDYDTKEGLIHMVGAKPEFRGLGLGNLMCKLALWVLKKEGMETSLLRTDDWRIPAIKTYLKIGFTPDIESEEDFPARWDKIFEIIK